MVDHGQTRLLRSDLEAEAITLEADARRLEQQLKDSDLTEDQLKAARRTFVEPRALAANALRNAKRALEAIPAMELKAS